MSSPKRNSNGEVAEQNEALSELAEQLGGKLEVRDHDTSSDSVLSPDQNPTENHPPGGAQEPTPKLPTLLSEEEYLDWITKLREQSDEDQFQEIISIRVKLYIFSQDSWFEHAVGCLKVLVEKDKESAVGVRPSRSGEKSHTPAAKAGDEGVALAGGPADNTHSLAADTETDTSADLGPESKADKQEVASKENKEIVDQSNDSRLWLLMRREDVLTLAVNQLITPKTTFQRSPDGKKLTWTALDFSYPEDLENDDDLRKGQTKTLCARFKQAAELDQFLEKVQDMRDKLNWV